MYKQINIALPASMPGWAKNEDVRSGWLLGLMYTPLLLEWSSTPFEGGGSGGELEVFISGSSDIGGSKLLLTSFVFSG